MSNDNKGMSCRMKCGLIGALIGILLTFILMSLTDMPTMKALIWGLVAFIVSTLVMIWAWCNGSSAEVTGAGVAAGAAVGAAVSEPDYAPAPLMGTPADDVKKAPAKDAEKKPVAKTASKPAAKKATPKKTAAKKPAAKKAAPKKAAAKPPVLYTKRPSQVDDLKLISGVGPKLENTCHEIGVYQFAQIANWKKADIATVDDKLSFKGRIERDEWVKQAKVLAKGGETEFSKKKKK